MKILNREKNRLGFNVICSTIFECVLHPLEFLKNNIQAGEIAFPLDLSNTSLRTGANSNTLSMKKLCKKYVLNERLCILYSTLLVTINAHLVSVSEKSALLNTKA